MTFTVNTSAPFPNILHTRRVHANSRDGQRQQSNILLLQLSHDEDRTIRPGQRKVPLHGRTTEHELVIKKKKRSQTSGSVQLNVYLCLGPSLSLSVDVLIAGLSGVLCGAQKGSVMWQQRRVCLCTYGHNRDACTPIFVVSHVWNARYV